MSFGRNPHVAKAEAAEQKAQCSKDAAACEQAWREAARQWDRAADRETDDKRKTEYSDKAECARTAADESRGATPDKDAAVEAVNAKISSMLN
ncbi:MAG: hypothetical protein KC657_09585 [Myxococcales bacterium]|nr:hypothetical protein [Myxococcales bacterium]